MASFNQLTPPQQAAFDAIRRALGRDLLKGDWKDAVPPRGAEQVYGHCYVATEAAYYAFGREAGFVTYVAHVNGGTHWWLCNKDTSAIVDPTFEQTVKHFNYKTAGRHQPMRKGKGPDGMSDRCERLLRRAGLLV